MSRPVALIASLILSLLLAAITFGQTPDSTDTSGLLTNQDVQALSLSAGSGSQALSFVADPASSGGDILDVMVSDSSIKVSLGLPDGREITSTNALANGFEFSGVGGSTFANSASPFPFIPAGTHVIIKFPGGLAPGTYQVKLDATNTTSDAISLVTYFSSSSVRAALTTGASAYRVGDTVVVEAILVDGGSPIVGASVTAGFSDPAQPDVQPQQITLYDSGTFDAASGDGIYTGTFIADHTAEYSLAYQPQASPFLGSRQR